MTFRRPTAVSIRWCIEMYRCRKNENEIMTLMFIFSFHSFIHSHSISSVDDCYCTGTGDWSHLIDLPRAGQWMKTERENDVNGINTMDQWPSAAWHGDAMAIIMAHNPDGTVTVPGKRQTDNDIDQSSQINVQNVDHGRSWASSG